MAKSYSGDYFGINRIISAILCFFIGGILGGIARIVEGKPVAGIVRLVACLFGVGFIMNIVDFVLILVSGKILRVINS